MSEQYQNVRVASLPIRLGQFLKLANIAQDGYEATMRIQNGEVKVNGEIETKRGKKLQVLDTISVAGIEWRIVPPE
ncbi:MAG: RNA-binding S4 domain-containing protein [Desulforhopalus sp.]|nr:RNA-binding S4 domain-containing protein [Desulforhopalus sp.]